MEQNWIKTGSYCGLAGISFYFLAAFASLPEQLSLTLVFHFGIFLMVGFMGLYYFFKATSGPSIAITLMVYAGIIAGAFVTVMLVVQQALFTTYDNVKLAATDAEKTMLKQVSMLKLMNTTQLGMDITWDLFIGWAGILLGLAMLNSRMFYKSVALIIILINLLLLVFNLYTFPNPPGESGLIDMGPFVACSYIGIFSYILFKQRSLSV